MKYANGRIHSDLSTHYNLIKLNNIEGQKEEDSRRISRVASQIFT
jgi:hypothetical protein